MATSSTATPHPAIFAQGTELYGIGTVIRLLAKLPCPTTFVCTSPGPMTDWLRAQGCDVVLTDALTQFVARGSVATLAGMPAVIARVRRDAAKLAPILRERGVTHVHTHWLPHQLIGGFLRRHGFRCVWQINNNTNRRRLMGAGVRLNHLMARWGADLLLPASDFIADHWRGCGVPVRTIRNAAESLWNELPEHARAPMLRCLVSGRLEASKGHHVAVEAVLRARDAGVNITLDVFGGPLEDNPYKEELAARIAAAGADDLARFRGFCTDLRQRHTEYDLGLQCRIDPEPCSLWVCETMVDGLPLIASATGGTPELVADGVTGLLVRPGDALDLSEKLVQLAGDRDRLERMRRAAFDRGQAHFTGERFRREVLAAYVSV